MPDISARLHKTILLGVLVLFTLVSMGGCSNAGRRIATIFKWNTKINVKVDKDANQTYATAVDVVTPLTDTTQEKMMKMTAREWFTGKEQFSRDYSQGNDYIVVHKEFAAGSSPDPIEIPFKVDTKSIIIYGDYRSKGMHRFRSTLPGEDLDMHLMRMNFTVVPSGGGQLADDDEHSCPAPQSGSSGGGSSGTGTDFLLDSTGQVTEQAQQVGQQLGEQELNQATGTQGTQQTTTGTTTGTSTTAPPSTGGFSIGF